MKHKFLLIPAFLLTIALTALTACSPQEQSGSSSENSGTPSQQNSEDPLFVADEPARKFTPTGTDAETDEILGLIKNYAQFYYNYFYESDWIEVDASDKYEENCLRATNVTAEQFFGKLNAYADENLADKLFDAFGENAYVSDGGKLYTTRPGGAAGWGVCETELTLGSIEHTDDNITVNFIRHDYHEDNSGKVDTDKNVDFSVKLVNTPEGLRVCECENWLDLNNFQEITIDGKSYPF